MFAWDSLMFTAQPLPLSLCAAASAKDRARRQRTCLFQSRASRPNAPCLAWEREERRGNEHKTKLSPRPCVLWDIWATGGRERGEGEVLWWVRKSLTASSTEVKYSTVFWGNLRLFEFSLTRWNSELLADAPTARLPREAWGRWKSLYAQTRAPILKDFAIGRQHVATVAAVGSEFCWIRTS